VVQATTKTPAETAKKDAFPVTLAVRSAASVPSLSSSSLISRTRANWARRLRSRSDSLTARFTLAGYSRLATSVREWRARTTVRVRKGVN